MNNWKLYDAVLKSNGENAREIVINNSKRSFKNKISKNPSKKTVLVNNKQKDLLILNTDKEFELKFNSLPDEFLNCGDIIFFNNLYWIVSSINNESEITQSGKLTMCQYLLSWQNSDGNIIKRWCSISDASEKSDGINIGRLIDDLNTRISVMLPYDSETAKIKTGKRFLIDINEFDEDKIPNTYIVTKSVPTINTYGLSKRNGTINIVMSGTQFNSDTDNKQLMIADYFIIETTTNLKNKCSIEYKDDLYIKAGGTSKEFISHFFDENNKEVNTITPIWTVTVLPEFEDYISHEIINNKLYITVKYLKNIIGTQIKVELSDINNIYQNDIYVKVRTIL